MPEKNVIDEAINLRDQRVAEELAQAIQKHAPHIQESLASFGKWLSEMSTQLAPFIRWVASVDWKHVQERIEGFPEASSQAMKVASREGWFFNWQGGYQDVMELTESIQQANSANDIDNILMAYYNDYWDYYSELLAEKYPARQMAIHAAIGAHRSFAPSGYSLSIPVFLAQADGIFSEVTGISSAMDKVRGQNVIKGSQWLSTQIGADEKAIGSLLPALELHELDILKSQVARKAKAQKTGKVFDALNRHQVMHGEVSDYGTEINSMKAFSFMLFVALHVPEILEDAKKRSAQKG
ncbi:hypothetical protein [Pseudomonas cichorii]|uniref:hypothetical protein n=1 Tax=Pseudomonas cichorii TaxID=36746 RepID=UPI001C89E49B|nr:hypothetical protein [Pseudomonas cichorii]MBX8484823.1 hypothetical protein [Pseudomonas cichorii]